MLVRYKKSCEKIAMGLLSFMPNVKDVKQLVKIITKYDKDPNWHLYLWKEDEDILGVIGLKLTNDEAIIQHLAVNPSHRNKGIGRAMIQEIQLNYEDKYKINANDSVKSFYNKCIGN